MAQVSSDLDTVTMFASKCIVSIQITKTYLHFQVLESIPQKAAIPEEETTTTEAKPDTAVIEIVPKKSKSDVLEVKEPK